MKESNSNNADMSGKAHYPPSGVGGINKHCPQQVVANAHYPVSIQNQQLPIKDELSRLQVQSLFEKNTRYSFQSNTFML